MGRVAVVSKSIVRCFLPSDKTFWRAYTPVIKVLKDSNEHKKIREKLIEHLSLNKNDTLLDAGCGLAKWLSECAPKVKMTVGTDSGFEMLQVAKRDIPQTQFVQADLEKEIPFKDNSFTKIGSILVYGYLTDREKALQEMIRILKPEGLIGIVTPIEEAKFFKVLKAEAGHRKKEHAIIRNLIKLPLAVTAVLFGKIAELKDWVGQWHFYSEEELIDEFRSEGLEIIYRERVYADQAILLIAKKSSV